MTKKERNKELREFNARGLVKELLNERKGYLVAGSSCVNSKFDEGVRKCLERKYHVIEEKVEGHEHIRLYVFDSTPKFKRLNIMRDILENIDSIEDNFREQHEFQEWLLESMKNADELLNDILSK